MAAVALEIVHVDAFTSRPFAGNPAAVCLLPEPRDETWMQLVAREMNTSGTAFLTARAPENGEKCWYIRFFTPTVEVELSGHTTLSAAHVLWETGAADPEVPLRFSAAGGELKAMRSGDWIELDFPALAQAMGVKARQVAEPDDIVPAFREAMDEDGPILLDVRIKDAYQDGPN